METISIIRDLRQRGLSRSRAQTIAALPTIRASEVLALPAGEMVGIRDADENAADPEALLTTPETWAVCRSLAVRQDHGLHAIVATCSARWEGMRRVVAG